jgi:excisionase family DNA binding protein
LAKEAAVMLGVSIWTIRRAVADGALPAVRIRQRGNLRFRAADLDRFVSADCLPRVVREWPREESARSLALARLTPAEPESLRRQPVDG